jgi:hypothetical protein
MTREVPLSVDSPEPISEFSSDEEDDMSRRKRKGGAAPEVDAVDEPSEPATTTCAEGVQAIRLKTGIEVTRK